MSYLVLARKWRPRKFSELVGQEHVVRALSNALETGRVHHAFLFTGTRGVGKTTIARIFAKSLNCERGVGAEPCGVCEICQSVDQGRFVDLLEIDAASNTGVDDVREVIENAQYLPTRGRYKVYLVDEVHMLSKNAFNALLKTLEEPPEHVKFLLATTDPQKLPVTVLSRCLQFNLKRLTQAQIAGQMRHILEAEHIAAEEGAIAQLARAAEGSLRDGLSLLDQALAFGAGGLRDEDVQAMLGTVDRSQVSALLDALAASDGAALMQAAATIAGFAPDFSAVLDTFALALHRIQVCQLVPGAQTEEEGFDPAPFAQTIPPELIQLWYQMALHGQRDLELAPSPQIGFEMTLLRMLAFAPGEAAAVSSPARLAPAPRVEPVRAAMPQEVPRAAPMRDQVAESAPATVYRPETRSFEPRDPAPHSPPPRHEEPPAQRASTPLPLATAEDWIAVLARANLRGPTKELASRMHFVGIEGEALRVHLPPAFALMNNPVLEKELVAELTQVLGFTPRLVCVAAPNAAVRTFGDHLKSERDARQQQAEADFADDPTVRHFLDEGAHIRPDSIRPR